MYGFGTTVKGEMGPVVDKVTEELGKEGFGVLTDIDVAGTLKKKLDLDRAPYRILGACNPSLAVQAIDAEPEIGLLLPCNVVVRQLEGDQVQVSFMDPMTVLGLVENPALEDLGKQVTERLQRVCDALG